MNNPQMKPLFRRGEFLPYRATATLHMGEHGKYIDKDEVVLYDDTEVDLGGGERYRATKLRGAVERNWLVPAADTTTQYRPQPSSIAVRPALNAGDDSRQRMNVVSDEERVVGQIGEVRERSRRSIDVGRSFGQADQDMANYLDGYQPEQQPQQQPQQPQQQYQQPQQPQQQYQHQQQQYPPMERYYQQQPQQPQYQSPPQYRHPAQQQAPRQAPQMPHTDFRQRQAAYYEPQHVERPSDLNHTRQYQPPPSGGPRMPVVDASSEGYEVLRTITPAKAPPVKITNPGTARAEISKINRAIEKRPIQQSQYRQAPVVYPPPSPQGGRQAPRRSINSGGRRRRGISISRVSVSDV